MIEYGKQSAEKNVKQFHTGNHTSTLVKSFHRTFESNIVTMRGSATLMRLVYRCPALLQPLWVHDMMQPWYRTFSYSKSPHWLSNDFREQSLYTISISSGPAMKIMFLSIRLIDNYVQETPPETSNSMKRFLMYIWSLVNNNEKVKYPIEKEQQWF